MTAAHIPLATPMAVVSMGCRLPGGVASPSDLWNLLTEGKSGRTRIPSKRFNADAFTKGGAMKTDHGYFITEDVNQFDPGFFNISPLEALSMDPQQRKFLEVCYETFESAGLTLESLRGSNTGVFVGNFTDDWQDMLRKDTEHGPAYAFPGGGPTIISNRVNYVFKLNGPSFTVDTACSSSLYALNSACSAIERGECTAALVGGTNLVLTPDLYIQETQAGVLSPTGACHTFDASADGYGRADGIGALYIKKLSDAIADGNPIRAVIRATAVNANDYSENMLKPHQQTQAAVIRQAYQRAGIVNLAETGYFEAHGTGTPTGDPIEVAAIRSVFSSVLSAEDQPLLIGSVKTNLGHSEAASGISSIIKVVLALESGIIPPTYGLTKLNPKIDLSNMKVVTSNTPWPQKPLRRASINSFGYGGANAHAILESADSIILDGPVRHSLSMTPAIQGKMNGYTPTTAPRFLVPLSAQSKASLGRLPAQIFNALKSHDTIDVLHTLTSHRSNFAYRAFTTLELLEDYSEAEITTGMDKVSGTSEFPMAFVFTGQGAQWPRVGVELLDQFPVFESTIAELDEFLATKLPEPPTWKIADVLRAAPEESTINDAAVSQPVTTAVQLALVDLLKSWGVKPSACVGHSSGEIAAAYAGGYISKRQAITASYFRGATVSGKTLGGSMLAVGMGASDVAEYLEGDAVIACYNSPQSVTLSGSQDIMQKIEAKLKEKGVLARGLKTGGNAYHSSHMKVFGPAYAAAATALYNEYALEVKETVPMISSVTSEWLVAKNFSMTYWRANLECPVLFEQAVEKMLSESAPVQVEHMLEVGLHSTLKGPLRQITGVVVPDKDLGYFSTIKRNSNSVKDLMELAGSLWLKGYPVDLREVNQLDTHQNPPKICVDLPRYPWNYDHGLQINYTNRIHKEYCFRKHGSHQLLGVKVPGGSAASHLWRKILKLEKVEWISDHKLANDVLFPAAGYLCMAIEAVRQLSPEPAGSISFRNVAFKTGLRIPENEDVELVTSLSPKALNAVKYADTAFDFSIQTCSTAGAWKEHCSGTVAFNLNEKADQNVAKASIECKEEVSVSTWYKTLKEVGLNYGPAFQGLEKIWVNPRAQHAFAKLNVFDDGELSDYLLHPTEIDACLQLGIISFFSGSPDKAKSGFIPFLAEEITFFANSSTGGHEVDAWASKCGPRAIVSGAAVRDAVTKTPLMVMNNFKAVSGEGLIQTQSRNDSLADSREPLVRSVWKPDIAGYFSPALGLPENPSASDVVTVLFDLLAHKNPNINIVEINTEAAEPSAAACEVLRITDRLRRCSSYVFTQSLKGTEHEHICDPLPEHAAALKEEGIFQRIFDVVFANISSWAAAELPQNLAHIQSMLKPKGYFIALNSASAECWSQDKAAEFGLKVVFSQGGVQLLQSTAGQALVSQKQVLLVHRHEATDFTELLETSIRARGWACSRVAFEDYSPPTQAGSKRALNVIVTAELEGSMMASMTENEWAALKLMVNTAASISWVTKGDLLNGGNPEMSIIYGGARAIQNENPAVKFRTFDFDEATGHDTVCSRILHSITVPETDEIDDFDFIFSKGATHIPRLYPDYDLNQEYRAVHAKNPVPTEQPLSQERVTLDINRLKPGALDDLAFVPDTALDDTPLEDGYVEVQAQVYGVNMKDVLILTGLVDFDKFPNECSGIVTRVGAGVSHVAPGDKVLAMTPGSYNSHLRTPASMCVKLEDSESFQGMATLPISYVTATYGLLRFANLQAGETVLIHAGSGSLGIAGIQLAKMVGAEVFTTVSSAEKRAFVRETFDIPEDHILYSRDTSFATDIARLTNGRGVDVVLSAMTGELLASSWACIADFGRFVDVGRRDVMDRATLEMWQFRKSAAFLSFDTQDVMVKKPELAGSLLAQVVGWVREGKISTTKEVKNFGVSEFSQALKYFGSHMGKILVTYSPESPVKVLPTRKPTKLRADASYLLVGASGGLGRSLVTRMASQGARHFIIMSRSGTSTPAAAALVNDLRAQGLDIVVAQGDVTKLEDVQQAAVASEYPIRGIVQAAMVLRDSWFDLMSLSQWNECLLPKVKGTQNLEQVFKDTELDFFVMTSSISGQIGTPGQSNYCAANTYLDSFARHRQAKGLAGASVALGMVLGVGYVHDHPEIEENLLKNGVKGVTEDEFLEAVDLCTRPKHSAPSQLDPLARGLLITGLETQQLLDMRDFAEWAESVKGTWRHRDIRFALLNRELEAPLTGASGGAEENSARNGAATAKLAALLRVPAESVEPGQTLASLGLDSIVGADFRNWLYKEMGLDISFFELLGPSLTVEALEAKVMAENGN